MYLDRSADDRISPWIAFGEVLHYHCLNWYRVSANFFYPISKNDRTAYKLFLSVLFLCVICVICGYNLFSSLFRFLECLDSPVKLHLVDRARDFAYAGAGL